MEEALRIHSWRGFLIDSIKATDIKSRADARKNGPFATLDKKRKVTWVSWSQIKKTQNWRRAHFRLHSPNLARKGNITEDIVSEIEGREVKKSESSKHFRAKTVVADYLKRILQKGAPAKWSFVDKRISSFPLSGNLMSDVVEIRAEYPIKTPFGKDYRLDIALLGEKINNEPLVLGAIEIEFNHEFEMLKCLMCKASGFPIVSLDIEATDEAELTAEWCQERLLETTVSSEDARRRNYIYIHDSLYPVYMDLPADIDKDRKHQYIVFIEDADFDSLLNLLNQLKKCLGLDDKRVLVQPVNCVNDQMQPVLRNEGAIAGNDWQKYNSTRYIRITIDKPITKSGPVYKYHLAMAKLINANFETLTGYKYKPGKKDYHPDNPLWITTAKHQDKSGFYEIAILPKHVSEPLGAIMAVLQKLS
jgi:hypothetical protein